MARVAEHLMTRFQSFLTNRQFVIVPLRVWQGMDGILSGKVDKT